jgi:hypothetical protein
LRLTSRPARKYRGEPRAGRCRLTVHGITRKDNRYLSSHEALQIGFSGRRRWPGAPAGGRG